MSNRARLARVERQLQRPAEPPTVLHVLPCRPSDALEYSDLPAWVCCHSDGIAHAGDGPHVCPLSTPGAPVEDMTPAQALAILRRARALGVV